MKNEDIEKCRQVITDRQSILQVYLDSVGAKDSRDLSDDEQVSYYCLYNIISKMIDYVDSLDLETMLPNVYFIKVYKHLNSVDLDLNSPDSIYNTGGDMDKQAFEENENKLYARRIIVKRIVRAYNQWSKKNYPQGYRSYSECFIPYKGVHSKEFSGEEGLQDWLTFKELCGIKVTITNMCATPSEGIVITYTEDMFTTLVLTRKSYQQGVGTTELKEIEKELKEED